MAAPTDYIAYYRLTDNADDETGNYSGSISGTVTFDGNALISDGGGYVYAPAPVVSDNASVTFWVKVTKPYNSTGTVFAYNHSGYEDPLVVNFPHWDNNCTFEWGVDGSSGTSSFVIDSEWEEKWTHISFIINDTKLKIYINDSLYRTITGSFDGYDFSSRYILFLYSDIDGERTPGEIARVRIYNYELTTTQISDIYNEEKNDFPNGMVFEIFSDVSQDIVIDWISFLDTSRDLIPMYQTFSDVSEDDILSIYIFQDISIDHQGYIQIFSDVSANTGGLKWSRFYDISNDESTIFEDILIKRVNS